MNDSVHGITVQNLLRTLPEVLKGNSKLVALAEVAATLLEELSAQTNQAKIYANIDFLQEEVLDILAYDLKVDWWDPNYTLEEKRRTLKDSWAVHRILGTKAAVELAISAIYPEAKVSEWFEYGGQPYHFKLRINPNGEEITSERHRRVLERVAFYKNLRSHLDEVEYGANTWGDAKEFTWGHLEIKTWREIRERALE